MTQNNVTMNAVHFILEAFDDAWNHRWESVRSVLEGVTPDEAGWQHPAYRDVEPEAGLPLPGTILWHLAHLEYCTRYYTDVLHMRPVEGDLPVSFPTDRSLSGLLRLLSNAREGLRRELSLLNDTDLAGPCRPDMNVAEFVRMVLRHESWHGGQIALVRRLYRER